MSPHTRRQALRAVGVCSPLVLAGCLTGRSSPNEMRLEQLQVVNYVQESHTVSVEITDDDEPVYHDSVDVPSAAEDTTGRGNDTWSDGAFEDYPTEAGAYMIRTWLDTQSRDEGRTVDLREYEHDCVEMRVLIGDPRMDLGSTLSIWRSFGCSAEREDAG